MIKKIFCDWLGWHSWRDDDDAPFAGLLQIPVVCPRCGAKKMIGITPWKYSELMRKRLERK